MKASPKVRSLRTVSTAQEPIKGKQVHVEMDPLTYLKTAHPRLHGLALPHTARILSRVQPKRTNAQLFKALASSIVSQQLSLKAAQSIFNRLEKNLGGKVTATAIKATPASLLRASGLSEAKTRSLQELSEVVASGKLNLLSLKKRTPDEAVAELTAIRGIGPWTAEMFLIFALGSPDVFSPGDLILARKMEEVMGLQKGTSKKELTRLAEAWSPHRSFVSLLFWTLNDSK